MDGSLTGLPLLAAGAILFIAAGVFIGIRISSLSAENKFVKILQTKEAEWQILAEEAKRISLAKSRAVMGGNFSEQLAPFLPDFPFDPTEVRFIGKPIDFIVFRGLSQGSVSEVAFIEIKSGQSKLSRNEISIRDAIQGKRVSFVEYRVPDQLVK